MLNLKNVRKYCLGKKGVTEDFPFDQETLTIKVGSKMFVLTNVKSPSLRLNLKCDPMLAKDLRDQYESVVPGYHMNKEHWNTVIIDGTIPDDKIFWMIDHSYDLVFSRLTKKERETLN